MTQWRDMLVLHKQVPQGYAPSMMFPFNKGGVLHSWVSPKSIVQVWGIVGQDWHGSYDHLM